MTTTLPARRGDGTPEFVLTLAEALADAFNITILSPRVPGSLPRERVGDVGIHRFPYFPERWEGLASGAIVPNLKAEPWRWLEAPPLVAALNWHGMRLTRRLRPALIHAHWIIPGGLVALSLRRAMGVPYVLTIHGADAYALHGPLLRRMKARIVRGAAVATPVSRDIADRLLPPGSPDRLIVPMGVDAEAIRRAVGPRQPIAGRFLFVGRLAEKKGVDVLIRALQGVPGAHVVVAGDGPERHKLKALARELRVLDRVTLLGTLPHDQIIRELRRAAALVIPSKVAAGGDQEGTPVVLGEGMAAGVPVIASSLGGLAEYMVHGETGILTEPASVPSLTRALGQALVDQRFLESLGEKAQKRVRQHLDIKRTRDAYSAFYRQAIVGRPQAPSNEEDER